VYQPSRGGGWYPAGRGDRLRGQSESAKGKKNPLSLVRSNRRFVEPKVRRTSGSLWFFIRKSGLIPRGFMDRPGTAGYYKL
jgi:hypothetical protein